MKTLMMAALMLGTSNVSAQFYRGSDLYQLCTGDTSAGQAQCIGYVVGVYEGYLFGWTVGASGEGAGTEGPKTRPGFCMQDGLTAGQLRDVAVKYMADNPGERNRTASVVVARAFSVAFPCAPGP